MSMRGPTGQKPLRHESRPAAPYPGKQYVDVFLKLSTRKKFVLGAFPICMYGLYHLVERSRTTYNFQLHQSEVFKKTVSVISDSTEIGKTYGRNVKLQPASIWTFTSGFMPWIKHKHVWIGFSGSEKDGWIKINLERSSFETSRENLGKITKQVDAGMFSYIRGIVGKSSEASSESAADDTQQHVESQTACPPDTSSPPSTTETRVEEDNTVKSTVANRSTADNTVSETTHSSVQNTMSSEEKSVKDTVELANSNCPESPSSDASESPSSNASESTTPEVPDEPNSKEQEYELQQQLEQELSEQAMAELRARYPNLPENFGRNDIEQAMKIEVQRKIADTLFNQVWDLSTVSIHPRSSGEDPVLVLYDPQGKYVDDEEYLVDNNFLTIRKPESWRTERRVVVSG